MTLAYNIDCMEYMKGLKDNAYDLAIVDPPYGIQELTGRHFAEGAGKLKHLKFSQEKNKSKEWDFAPTQEYFDELFRVSKNQIIWGANYFQLPPYRCFVYWDKQQAFGNFSKGELAFTSFDKPSKQFVMNNSFANRNKIHSCQKPVELYKFLLQTFAQKGDRILDTHLGSGSSRIACHDMGFDFVGLEIDKDYFEAQEKRFKAHSSQCELFEFSGGEVINE